MNKLTKADAIILLQEAKLRYENRVLIKENWLKITKKYKQNNTQTITLSNVFEAILERNLTQNEIGCFQDNGTEEPLAGIIWNILKKTLVENKNVILEEKSQKWDKLKVDEKFQISKIMPADEISKYADLQKYGLVITDLKDGKFSAVAKGGNAIVIARKIGCSFSENSNFLEKIMWKKQKNKEGDLYITGVLADKDLEETKKILKALKIDFSIGEENQNPKIITNGRYALRLARIMGKVFSEESLEAYKVFRDKQLKEKSFQNNKDYMIENSLENQIF